MKITTSDRMVSDVLKEFLFIPRFQRPYSWEKEQVEQFWNDTIVENPTDYFIGSIVLYKQGDELGIVDGQQRIVTILLILCALREAFDKNNVSLLAKGIQALVERTDVDAKNRYVLRTETSFPFLQDRILRQGPSELGTQPKSDEELLLNDTLTFLKERIDNAVASWPWPPKKGARTGILKTIRDRVLALKLITVDLDNEDDAYIIFETLNTRGKDLKVSHLVKNHLSRLMKAKNRALDPLKLKWEKLLETFETTQADLNVDSYLHHFWLSRGKEYVTAKKLYVSMKNSVTANNAQETLDNLLKDATLYRQIGEPSYGSWKKEDFRIRKSLSAISSVFNLRQPYPLLLSLIRCYRDKILSKRNLEATLWAVECFHFAFTAIAQRSSSGGVSLMYASWAQRLSNATSDADRQKILSEIKRNLRNRIPDKADFVAGFKGLRYSDDFTKQKRIVRYVLEHIEDHLSKSGVVVNYDQMTIEHIAPQKAASGAPSVSSEHIAAVGNQLLCNGALQDRLKNKPFANKRQILKGCGVAAAKDVVAKKHWDNRAIDERTDRLANLAYDEIWRA